MARVKYYDETTETWKYADEKLNIAPVQSVNGKVGAVTLDAGDVGAEGAGAVISHNDSGDAHSDIRALINNKIGKSDVVARTVILTLSDGSQIEAEVLVTGVSGVVEQYRNQVPLSIDTDGSIYNGCGYKNTTRLSSTGVEKTQANSTVTGYIPVSGKDVVRLGGAKWWAAGSGANYLCAYDSSFTFIGAVYGAEGNHYGTVIHSAIEYGEELTTVTLADNANIAYIRANWANGTSITGEDIILTINEEIV